jgi:hypothetical protein
LQLVACGWARRSRWKYGAEYHMPGRVRSSHQLVACTRAVITHNYLYGIIFDKFKLF